MTYCASAEIGFFQQRGLFLLPAAPKKAAIETGSSFRMPLEVDLARLLQRALFYEDKNHQ